MNTINQKDPEFKSDLAAKKGSSPNGFEILKNENENNINVNNKYNDRMIDANQSKWIVRLNRMQFSQGCITYYKVFLVFACIMALSAAVEIFIRFNVMNEIWLFAIEIFIVANIIGDFVSKMFVMVCMYIIYSNLEKGVL
jgi:hypothetical protein